MAECKLTTDEFGGSGHLDKAVAASNFRPLHIGATWGFDPKIFEYALTHLHKATLDSVLAELREYHHFDYVKCESKMLQGFVSLPFTYLGARHAFAYIVDGSPRAIVYSYYTNNPYDHLEWHYLFDPSAKNIDWDEILLIAELIKEQLYVYAGEPHVKKIT